MSVCLSVCVISDTTGTTTTPTTKYRLYKARLVIRISPILIFIDLKRKAVSLQVSDSLRFYFFFKIFKCKI